MTKGRKTVNVELLKEYLNLQLQRTDPFATANFKAGVIVAIEKLLITTDNYNGYRHLLGKEYGREWDRQYY
jgi:hypothetical protein